MGPWTNNIKNPSKSSVVNPNDESPLTLHLALSFSVLSLCATHSPLPLETLPHSPLWLLRFAVCLFPPVFGLLRCLFVLHQKQQQRCASSCDRPRRRSRAPSGVGYALYCLFDSIQFSFAVSHVKIDSTETIEQAEGVNDLRYAVIHLEVFKVNRFCATSNSYLLSTFNDQLFTNTARE